MYFEPDVQAVFTYVSVTLTLNVPSQGQGRGNQGVVNMGVGSEGGKWAEMANLQEEGSLQSG